MIDLTRFRDILQMHPFPTIEQAYAHVHREAVRQAVIIYGDSTNTPGAVLAAKGIKHGQINSSSSRFLSLSNGKPDNPKTRASSNGMKCFHCGNQKHTWETCFKLHGYPEWWNDLQARKCQVPPALAEDQARRRWLWQKHERR
jgi:hypothetical protein